MVRVFDVQIVKWCQKKFVLAKALVILWGGTA